MSRLGEALGVLVLACACAVGCTVGLGYGDYPPDAYIATTVPYYYNGYPTYYYGGHWYYRTNGRWQYYRQEPPALRDYRMHGAPVRRNFEPTMRGRPPAPAPRGGGGWRGGRR